MIRPWRPQRAVGLERSGFDAALAHDRIEALLCREVHRVQMGQQWQDARLDHRPLAVRSMPHALRAIAQAEHRSERVASNQRDVMIGIPHL